MMIVLMYLIIGFVIGTMCVQNHIDSCYESFLPKPKFKTWFPVFILITTLWFLLIPYTTWYYTLELIIVLKRERSRREVDDLLSTIGSGAERNAVEFTTEGGIQDPDYGDTVKLIQ